MSRTGMMVGTMCLCVAAGGVLADAPDNTLTNPSFENADPFFPSEPEGWTGFNISSPGWNTDFARTGTRSLALGPASTGAFTGWSTNLFDPNGDLYDPPYEFRGGDLYVSGWYLIPDEDPLAPGGFGAPLDLVTIKLEFRRVPPNFSIYQSFELPAIDVSTTGGQWVFYEQVFADANISDEFPPFPGSVTILPFRFDTGAGQEGTIYWDDLCIYQLAVDCFCDQDGNDALNVDDIDVFVTAFLGGDLSADCDGNLALNVDDIDCFVTCFLAGCD
ncbi:MAG: hypothetical protein DHS20C14_07110 [Phycisphaeraceae bacterium]|nr:MAG: hypothetical protein DHS20C14_07110 [Phycisphaeraceae bacterium]